MTEHESSARADETFWSRWDRQIRAQTRLARFERPDIGRSYPLPLIQHSRKVLRHFYYRATRLGPNTLYLGAPRVYFGLDYEEGTLVEEFAAEALGVASFEPTTYEVSETDQAGIRERAARLRALYDQVLPRYPDEPAGDAGTAFWALLQDVVPPLLVPYYRALSPEFMIWVQV